MPTTIDRHPSATTSTTGFNGNWTNPGNAYSSNDSYATCAPGRNQEFATNWRGFDFSAIPDTATITGITAHVEIKVSTAWSQGEFRSSVWPDVTAAAALTAGTTGAFGPNNQYTQSTASWPTSDTDWSFALTGTLPTVSQLKATNFGIRVQVSKGNNGTSYTISLDDIYLSVTYTAPQTQSVSGSASFTGAITKRGKKALTATQSFTVAIAKRTTRALTASQGFAGATTKQAKRALTAASSFTGAITSRKFSARSFTASVSPSATLANLTKRALEASAGFTGAFAALGKKALAATQAFSAEITRRSSRPITAAATFSGALSSVKSGVATPALTARHIHPGS